MNLAIRSNGIDSYYFTMIYDYNEDGITYEYSNLIHEYVPYETYTTLIGHIYIGTLFLADKPHWGL